MFRRVLNRNSDFTATAPSPPPDRLGNGSGSGNRSGNGNGSNQEGSPTRPVSSSRIKSFTDRFPSRKRGRRNGRSPIPRVRDRDRDQMLPPNTNNRHNRVSDLSGGRSVFTTAEDLMSIQSTITVETTRTSYNENRKPIPSFSQVAEHSTRNSHQVFCNPMNALNNLKNAENDIVVTHIYLKDLTINKNICSAFLSLIRGDNKSWESMAVDILRQKARWESITFEDCQNNLKPVPIRRPSRVVLKQIHEKDEYLEVCISFIISLDNTAHLHLSNLALHQPFTLQSITFAKHLLKLQFDLMDLSQTIGTLCHCLPQNTSLETLIASRCGLNDHQLAALMGSLPDQLLELRIFGNTCRTQGLAAAAILMQEQNKLEILDLSYQHLTRNGNGNDEKKQRDEEDTFDISWLMAALMSNTTLITLDLDNTGIDDNQLRHIIQALCENTTLEEIMLNHNYITNDGVAALAARFPEMQGLKKISMYSNLFDTPTTAPPPTEITTPSVMSNSTQKRSNHNQQDVRSPSIRIPSYQGHDDDSSTEGDDDDDDNDNDNDNDDDDDDRTINTAVSSLADETVFQQMENNPTMLPEGMESEVAQVPFAFERNGADGSSPAYGHKGEQQHYFDGTDDYDESVCPTEYDEVSVFTEVEAIAPYEYNPRDAPIVPEEEEESMPPPIPGAEFARNNTTTF
jgi:hypothetical protein